MSPASEVAISRLERLRAPQLAPLVFVANFLAVAVGYAAYLTPDAVAALWPATGMLLAILLACSVRRWPVVLISAAAAQLVFEQLFAEQPLPASLAFSAINVAESAFCAAWLRRWAAGRPWRMDHLPSLLAVVLVGALAGAVFGATLGAMVVWASHPTVRYEQVWSLWRSADSLGALLVTPLALSWLYPRSQDSELSRSRWIEAVALTASLFPILELTVGPLDLPFASPVDYPYAVFPWVIWAGVRFGVRGASLCSFVIGLLTVLHARFDQGPFVAAPVSPLLQILELQTFLTALAIAGLVSAALSADRAFAYREREATKQQLDRAQRMTAVGHLAGGLAHDLNNMLAVVAGNVELISLDLKAAPAPNAETGECLEEIGLAARRGRSLVQQLLLLARREPSRPQFMDLHDLVRALSPMLPHILREQVSVTLALSADRSGVRLDPVRFETALINLLMNSREAMPFGGELRIETESDTDHVRLRVIDTGCGIEPSALPHVAEPFHSTKPSDRATGLGLTTVLEIVERDGGHVTIESVVGKGTTVECCWPLAEPEIASAQALHRQRGTGLIVVCEDETRVREVASKLLSRAGYEVLEASDGHAALAALRERPDTKLLITDVIMPGLSGPQVAERAAELRPGLPVLYVSGYSEDLLSQQGMTSERDLLRKPFTQRELLSRVDKLLGAPYEA